MSGLCKRLLAATVAGSMLLFGACSGTPVVQGGGEATTTSPPGASVAPAPAQGMDYWPEPEFEEIASSWVYTDAGYVIKLGQGYQQGTVDLHIPTNEDIWPSASYASGSFVAAAWGTAPLHVAVTPDGGSSWRHAEIDTEADYILMKFSGPLDGMLVVQPGNYYPDEKEMDLQVYTTTDGGESWQQRASLPGAAFLHSLLVLGGDIAWVSYAGPYIGERYTGYTLYTLDGGASWNTPQVEYEPAMLRDGASPQFGMVPGKSEDGVWTLQASMGRQKGLGSDTYSFTPDESLVFHWNQPDWQLPDNVDPVRAWEYFTYFVPPETHDAASGVLTEPVEFFLACDAEAYMRLAGREIEYIGPGWYVVPTEVAQEMIELQYGIAEYDVTGFSNYAPEYGGLTHMDGHGGRMEMGYQRVREVGTNPDGTIRVVVEWLFMVDEYEPYAVTKVIEETFRVAEAYGEQYFTLLKASPL